MSAIKSRSRSRNNTPPGPRKPATWLSLPARGWVSVYDDERKVTALEDLTYFERRALELLINTPRPADPFEPTIGIVIENDKGDDLPLRYVPARPGMHLSRLFPERFQYRIDQVLG